MNRQYNMELALVFAIFIGFVAAHPVFEHKFKQIVNGNPCLKMCMDQATSDGIELSILKTANITGYLNNLDTICSKLEEAKQCVDECKVGSNHFALEFMTVVCSNESLAEVQLLQPCFEKQETDDDIWSGCQESCGNYDTLNDEVHQLTQKFKPDQNDAEKLAEITSKINNACSVLKCSDRCTAQTMSDKCGKVEDGRDAGSVLVSIIERVLKAKRGDLERMQLLDALAHTVPPQCNYMYMPEVMFNATKDQMALAAINLAQTKDKQEQVADVKPASDKKDLSLTLSQLQALLIKKQMKLLELQERNLRREAAKQDLEMELLSRKASMMDAHAYPNQEFHREPLVF